MAEAPKISVVTPCLNRAATIGATIESVLSQDYANWEHIVMDGGSNDWTVAVLKRAAASAALANTKLEVRKIGSACSPSWVRTWPART